jgi:Tfp pilus assembly protein FimT
MVMKESQNLRGVTLIELLLTVGIFIILAIISVPTFRYFQRESDLNNSTQEIINTLRLAQDKTLASEGGSNYGVHFEIEKFVLFEGTSYNPLATNNETHNLPQSVEVYEINLAGEETEVVFDRLTGETDQFGRISLRLKSDLSKISTVGIKSSGQITLGEEINPPDLPPNIDSRHVHFNYTRVIDTATEELTLTFEGPVVEEITIADYITGGQIDWEGEVDAGGDIQKLKIHTHRLNNPDTQFCIHRDRRYNNKALTITISGDGSGSLIDYSADGLITTNTSIHADEPQWQ